MNASRPLTRTRAWLLLTLTTSLSLAAVAAPKYGPAAIRLHDDNAYVRAQPAPDFWALMPYYLPQLTDSSCSVASVAMLVNALRADAPLTASDRLATHTQLLERTAHADWTRAVANGGDGVGLKQLGPLIRQALAAYSIDVVSVDVLHAADAASTAELLTRVRALLIENEASDRDFIVVNYLQSVLTGDPDGAVGHIAPIAAYDAANRRVLVMDPDRDWYDPYWVSDEALVAAMATTDSTSGRSRGLIHVRRAPTPAPGPKD